MKMCEAIDKINNENIKQIYGSKKHKHVVIWEEDKEWEDINKLMAEGKL